MYKKFILIGLLLFPFQVFAEDGYIFDLQGAVLVNGKIAEKDTTITFGDEIITGGHSRIGLRLDGNVYRLGSRSHLTLPEGTTNITFNFIFGSLLAVFRHDSHKTIHTTTGVLGVRGTGAYLQVGSEETYLCTCYGDIDFMDNENVQNAAHIHALYHNAITFTHSSRAFGLNQPLLGHVSEDMQALEAQADRNCPLSFVPENASENSVILDLKR